MEAADRNAKVEAGTPVRVEPDLDFIRALLVQRGDTYKKCVQCGTCAATCALSPDTDPFPRKEMAWAVWGMKDRLLKDPDVWLCHQCNDCSARCPRGARPGEVLAAVRREAVMHYAFPRFFARAVNRPSWAPLMLGIPIALLTLALVAKGPIEQSLGITQEAGERVLYHYSSIFPHWLLNSFFGLFSLLALLALMVGVVRFWKAMGTTVSNPHPTPPVKGMLPSLLTTIRKVFSHEDFSQCERAGPRYLSHACVLFGFFALTLVTLWVITAKINPLITSDFIYPFQFLNPWKMLANLGGAALLAGCLLMIRDRLRDADEIGAGTYFDWALLASLSLVVITGFITEALHYLRLEPHRHLAYFVHLVFVFAVLIYLPYSKLAHMAYRGAALVFAERTGRAAAPPAAEAGTDPIPEGTDHAGDATEAP